MVYTLLVLQTSKPTPFILNTLNIALQANLMPSITKKRSHLLPPSFNQRKEGHLRVETSGHRLMPKDRSNPCSGGTDDEGTLRDRHTRLQPLLLSLQHVSNHNLAYHPCRSLLHRWHKLLLLFHLLTPINIVPRPRPPHNFQQPHRPLHLPQTLQRHPGPRNFIN